MAWRLGEVMNDNHRYDKYLYHLISSSTGQQNKEKMSHNSGPIVEFYYDVSNNTSSLDTNPPLQLTKQSISPDLLSLRPHSLHQVSPNPPSSPCPPKNSSFPPFLFQNLLPRLPHISPHHLASRPTRSHLPSHTRASRRRRIRE